MAKTDTIPIRMVRMMFLESGSSFIVFLGSMIIEVSGC